MALKEGVVAGGGAALSTGGETIPPIRYSTPDERCAAAIVREALSRPLRRIVKNAGYEPDAVIAQLRTAGTGHAFDSTTGAIRNVGEAGAPLDPVGVLRLAVKSAIALADDALQRANLATGMRHE